jgi:autotransporter passenger strand-loop-strand repeat protein
MNGPLRNIKDLRVMRVMTNIFVSSGVTSTGLTITSGNAVFALPGGTIVSTTAENGGEAFIDSGYASRTFLIGDVNLGNFGQQVIFGGVASGTIVGSGGIQTVSGGGVDDGSTVSSGGIEFVIAGVASGTTIIGGGESIFSAGQPAAPTSNQDQPVFSAVPPWARSSTALVF